MTNSPGNFTHPRLCLLLTSSFPRPLSSFCPLGPNDNPGHPLATTARPPHLTPSPRPAPTSPRVTSHSCSSQIPGGPCRQPLNLLPPSHPFSACLCLPLLVLSMTQTPDVSGQGYKDEESSVPILETSTHGRAGETSRPERRAACGVLSHAIMRARLLRWVLSCFIKTEVCSDSRAAMAPKVSS